MSAQVILRIAGIAALVVALLFVILAIHYFITNNIKAVMDDLSGKARAQGMASTRRAVASSKGRGSQARGRTAPTAARPTVTAGSVSEGPGVQAAGQDEAPSPFDAFQAPVLDDEDDMGTVVVDVDFGTPHAAAGPQTAEAAPAHTQNTSEGAMAFRVVRSIILCDSNQIIAAE